MGFYDWLNDRLKLLAYQICDPTKPKTPSDVTTQIAKQAYGLYEQQGHREGPVPSYAKATKGGENGHYGAQFQCPSFVSP